MIKKETKIGESVYTPQSFVAYVYSRNGNFSTSTSYEKDSRLQVSDDNRYQVRNKITERIVHATKQK